jgi:hypothetical protein
MLGEGGRFIALEIAEEENIFHSKSLKRTLQGEE